MPFQDFEIHPRDPYRINIHETAKLMVADGFYGQNMRNPSRCEEYILIAANDPDIERKLPPRGFSFGRRAISSIAYGRHGET